jgi:hypothetical protein
MLQACSPNISKKTVPVPSASSVQEQIHQLKIMSTPPQKWELEIETGQKKLDSQQYLFKNVQWHNESWQFRSQAATQEDKNSDIFLFNAIHGTTTPQQVELTAGQSKFNSVKGALEGEALIVKAYNDNWQISAEHYHSQPPWNTLVLQQVKGTFKR